MITKKKNHLQDLLLGKTLKEEFPGDFNLDLFNYFEKSLEYR